MRLKIECILENDVVNISYNRKILSFFKKRYKFISKI